MRTREKDLENGGSEKVGTDAAGMRELLDDKSRRFRAGRGIFQLEVLAMEQVTALSTPTYLWFLYVLYLPSGGKVSCSELQDRRLSIKISFSEKRGNNQACRTIILP